MPRCRHLITHDRRYLDYEAVRNCQDCFTIEQFSKVYPKEFEGRIYICRFHEDIMEPKEPWSMVFAPLPPAEDNGPLKSRKQSRLEKAIREGYYKPCSACTKAWELFKWPLDSPKT